MAQDFIKEDALAADNIIITKQAIIPVISVHMHPQNPRVGDVDAIVESFKKNGMYQGIVVNERTGDIIVGNHRWLAARKLGWERIPATFVDVDEEDAVRIMLADNRTSELGSYDEERLARLIESLPTYEGTGWKEDDFDFLIEEASVDAQETLEEINTVLEAQQQAAAAEAASKTFDGAALGEEPDPRQSEPGPMPEKPPTVEKTSSEIPGMFQFKPPTQLVFPTVGDWEIPELRTDMLMTWEEVPEKLDTWAGTITRNWPDPEQWWWYNWGVDSTSGMNDLSKVIVAFYCYDNYFENWYEYPDRYVGKILNSGIKYITTPNFSEGAHKPVSLMALYKARWLGRYFQEAGLKVIPDITWVPGDMPWLHEMVIETLPSQPPLISMQVQTIGGKGDERQENIDQLMLEMQTVIDVLGPQSILFYACSTGRELIETRLDVEVPHRILECRWDKIQVRRNAKANKDTI